MIIQEAQSDGLLLPISCSCLSIEVSRSGYYEWLKQSEKFPCEDRKYDLDNQILSKPSKRQGYHRAEPVVGFRYHLCPASA